MADEVVELIEPEAASQPAFLAMVNEYAAAGEERYARHRERAASDWPGLVRELCDDTLPRDPNLVPGRNYFLVRNGSDILGRTSVRYYLNENLKHEGGHIGYDIRPSERGKGYGTLILKLALGKAREIGLRRALVTCDKDNLASARVIRKNGGRLESEVVSYRTGKLVQRYWIEL